jgi:hypothetical protein
MTRFEAFMLCVVLIVVYRVVVGAAARRTEQPAKVDNPSPTECAGGDDVPLSLLDRLNAWMEGQRGGVDPDLDEDVEDEDDDPELELARTEKPLTDDDRYAMKVAVLIDSGQINETTGCREISAECRVGHGTAQLMLRAARTRLGL